MPIPRRGLWRSWWLALWALPLPTEAQLINPVDEDDERDVAPTKLLHEGREEVQQSAAYHGGVRARALCTCGLQYV